MPRVVPTSWPGVLLGLAALLLTACAPDPDGLFAPATPTSQHPARPSGVRTSGEIVYGNDGAVARRCDGPSSKLHYVVIYPSSDGPHPVVFGMTGTGFAGSATCDVQSGESVYRNFDPFLAKFAEAGYVAVNVEYHGTNDGLYGDMTYPGAGRWGTMADATVELDIKAAVVNFFAHDPSQWGADGSRGVIAFGSSSGAHNAYMLAITGVPGHHISAAIGWSGFPDISRSGSTATSIFDTYMRTTSGSDIENFGDPEHRVNAESPSMYAANGSGEFIASAGSEGYISTCQTLNIAKCYLRITDTTQHAAAYALYLFSGAAPEISIPPAARGTTIIADSIEFADAVLTPPAMLSGSAWPQRLSVPL